MCGEVPNLFQIIPLIFRKFELATKMNYSDNTDINQITKIQDYDLRIEGEKSEGSRKDERAAYQ